RTIFSLLAFAAFTQPVAAAEAARSVEAQASPSRATPPGACAVGSYLMADGTVLDIGPSEPGKLRWRLQDGRTGVLTPQEDGRWTSTLGWTDWADGHQITFSDCERGEIRFDDVAGRRQPLVQIDTRFQGSGV